MKPLGERVIVEEVVAELVTEGGLHLPEEPERPFVMGKVIAVGSGDQVAVGDMVVLSKFGSRFIVREQRRLHIVDTKQVLAVLEEGETI